MPVVALVAAGVRLVETVIARLPEPDPEIRRLRLEHNARLRELRLRFRQDRWEARNARVELP